MPRKNLSLLFLMIVTASISACGAMAWYRGAAIEGRVIDAATREPLAGVIVVARWSLWGGLHADDMGNLQMKETVTAADGSYRFAAWGPRRGKFMAQLDPGAPMLYFFKPGYGLRVRANDRYRPGVRSNPHASDWHGKDVELEPPSRPAEWGLDDSGFQSVLVSENGCGWQHVPRFTAAGLLHPNSTVRASMPWLAYLWLGEPTFEDIVSLDRRGAPTRCADPRVVLREFLPSAMTERHSLTQSQRRMKQMLEQMAQQKQAEAEGGSAKPTTPMLSPPAMEGVSQPLGPAARPQDEAP